MPIRTTRSFSDYVARSKARHGDRWDTSDLNLEFVPYFESGERVEVQFWYGEKARGFVGVTTGWETDFSSHENQKVNGKLISHPSK